MKNLILFITCILFAYCTHAQQNYIITGSVTTVDGFAPAGNIIALSSIDSSFLKGDYFIDGQLLLEGVEEEELIIKLSSMEFDDYYVEVNFNGDSIVTLGEIIVDRGGFQMEEVIVKSRRPTYTQQANGDISVLIENSTLAASSSTMEILAKAPDVLVNEDGQITIFGKGNALIYLNGKRIDQNQLSLIAPANIKKITIIRSPSAKYDAEGAAVIEIHTIQNSADGYRIKLTQNVDYSTFAGFATYSDINLTYNKGRLSTKANYSMLQGKDRHILHTTRNRIDPEVFIKTNLLTEWSHRYDNFSKFGLGLQYDIKENNYFSLEYSGFYEKLGGNQYSTNTIENLTDINFYKSDIQRNELDINNSLSLNYKQSTDTLGSNLFIAGQYSGFDLRIDNPIYETRNESNLVSETTMQNINDFNVDVLSAQIDYTKIYNSKSSLEAGMKFSSVANRSDVKFSIADLTGEFQDAPSLSNDFSYDESVSAIYLNFQSEITSSLKYSLGLRGEYTDYTLALSSKEGLDISDKYLNVFPQLSITKQLTSGRSIGFYYSSRIRRVPYQRLNPVLIYQDPYTSIQGNPESIPEKIHSFELNTQFNQTNMRVGYAYTIDPFGGGAIRGEDERSYILIRLNFAQRHELFASLSKTFETSWLSSTNIASIRYTDIIDKVHNFENVGAKPNLYLYSNNRISVSKLFNMEMSFYYLGDNNEGIYQRKSSWNMNIGIDKSFMEKKLKVQLTLNDIFHSVRAAGDYSIGETDIYFGRKWNSNFLRLSVSYNFGKLTSSKYKNTQVGSSENDRVN